MPSIKFKYKKQNNETIHETFDDFIEAKGKYANSALHGSKPSKHSLMLKILELEREKRNLQERLHYYQYRHRKKNKQVDIQDPIYNTFDDFIEAMGKYANSALSGYPPSNHSLMLKILELEGEKKNLQESLYYYQYRHRKKNKLPDIMM